jgi:excisionase family DNA binding protein
MDALLISRKEAARTLGISLRSLGLAVRGGLLKPRRFGRRVLFPPDELKRFASRDHGCMTPDQQVRDAGGDGR